MTTTAVVGGTVITATGETPLTGATVLISGDQIAAVRSDASVPSGALTIDATGMYVTPGLIDTNVHLVLMIVPEFYVKYEDRFADIAIQAAQVALKYGITTVMDSWGPLGPLLEARDRISSGEVTASRLLVAGNIVGLGGPYSPYFLNGRDLRQGNWVHRIIRERINRIWEENVGPRLTALTPSEVATEMRRYLERGVDFVKVAVSGHSLDSPEPLMFSPAALEAMRDEVWAAGITFQTHTATVESLRLAVELGADHLQHPEIVGHLPSGDPAGPRLVPQDIIAQIVEKNIYCGLIPPSPQLQQVVEEWVPSPRHRDRWVNQAVANHRQESDRDRFETHFANVRRFLEAKAPFTLATDQGPEAAELGPVLWGRMGRRHFEVMESLQSAGADPMEIVVGATRRGAEAYRLGDELGTIEPGKKADLLILDGDPLTDVRHFRDIVSVVKDGVVVDRAALPAEAVLEFDPEMPWPW